MGEDEVQDIDLHHISRWLDLMGTVDGTRSRVHSLVPVVALILMGAICDIAVYRVIMRPQDEGQGDTTMGDQHHE